MKTMRDPAEVERRQPSAEDSRKLREMFRGYHVSQALYVVAELGIADLLREGVQDTDDLARSTQSHAPTLYRIMRFLAGLGVFEEVAPRRFELTLLGAPLCSDAPRSLRSLFRFWLLRDAHWLPWGRLLETVRTGATSFDLVHGMTLFDYYDQHPDATAGVSLLEAQAMSSVTAVSGPGTASAYDFSTLGTVVDVGGSEGQLLAAILERYSQLRGILFDRPAAVSTAPALLARAGVAVRCSIVTGSFFESVPSDGDAYILRHILHDWSDERCLAILRVCREALPPRARLLIVERTMLEDAQIPMDVLHADLEMLVMCGGKERTRAQYARLLTDAGFRLTNTVATGEEPPHTIYEAIPV
jgi:hypothetical protein